jgi:hypothetical protein
MVLLSAVERLLRPARKVAVHTRWHVWIMPTHMGGSWGFLLFLLKALTTFHANLWWQDNVVVQERGLV